MTSYYKPFLTDRSFMLSTLVGLGMISLGLVSVLYSTNYANESASNSVTDLILSNVPVYDVEIFFVYGALGAILLSVIIFLTIRLAYLPFALKSAAVFLGIRSLFVSLTHISPYPSHITISESALSSYRLFQAVFSGDDLFFSGHVGLTFLVALILWSSSRWLGAAYVLLSVFFGVVVLLGHLHYSIDVFAAFFITYTIFVITTHLFSSDYRRALESHHP